MAFVFSSLVKPSDRLVKVEYVHIGTNEAWSVDSDSLYSITCVPAVGADPRKTWARQHHQLDEVLQSNLESDAQIHLYDHLTKDERRVEIKPSETSNNQKHKKSA